MSAFTIEPKALFNFFDAPAVAKAAAAEAQKGSELELAAEHVAAAAVKPMETLIAAGLSNVFQTHVMMNGERPTEKDAAVAWDTDLDEAVETWADATIRNGVGVDGIGEVLNTLRATDDEARQRWAHDTASRWAPQVVDAMMKDLTPAKVLSAAGVVKKDLPPGRNPAGEGGAAAGASVAAAAPTLSEDIHAVVSQIKAFCGMMGIASAEELTAYLTPQIIKEQLWSVDEAMRGSALTRIGASAAEPALGRIVTSGKMTVDDLIAAVFDASAVPAAAASPAGAKPAKPGKASGGKRKKRDAPVTAANDAVAILRARGGMKDADLAKALGLSRQGMVNIATEQTGWAPDSAAELAQVRELANALIVDANRLHAILAEFGA